MKRYLYTLCLLLASSIAIVSCMGDNDTDTTIYNETALVGANITAVNRYIHVTTDAGKDSVYKKAATDLPNIHIDQENMLIFNTDSLQYDCDMKHVLLALSKSTYSGSVVIKSAISDSLFFYSSTDSIDFTVPREVRVYNTDGSRYRTYTISLVKHTVPHDKLIWEKMPVDSFPEDITREVWEKKVAAAGFKSFIGYTVHEAYAVRADGQIMVSYDGGDTWSEDVMDDSLKFMPTSNIGFTSYPFEANEDTDYQILAGQLNDTEVVSMVWRKVAEYGNNHHPCKWVHVPFEDYNRYVLPAMYKPNLLYYHEKIFAIDMGIIRYSRDGGITWHWSDNYELPSDDLMIVEARTENDYIWLKDLDTNTVWRGVIVDL